jgi:hypothetical protein
MPNLENIRPALARETFVRKADHQVQSILVTAMLLCFGVGAAAMLLN